MRDHTETALSDYLPACFFNVAQRGRDKTVHCIYGLEAKAEEENGQDIYCRCHDKAETGVENFSSGLRKHDEILDNHS